MLFFDNFDPVAHISGTFFMYITNTNANIAQELDDNVALFESSVIMVSVTTASKACKKQKQNRIIKSHQFLYLFICVLWLQQNHQFSLLQSY